MTRDFVEANNASRERMETFVNSLTGEDLARVNAEGWTVATLLGHLAYWDHRMVVLLNRWLAEGVGLQVSYQLQPVHRIEFLE